MSSLADIAFRRAIAKLAGERIRRRKIPLGRPPNGARLRYYQFLRKLQQDLVDIFESEVWPEILKLIPRRDSAEIRLDGTVDDILRVFANFRVLFANAHPTDTFEAPVSQVAQDTGSHNATVYRRQMLALFGIEVITPAAPEVLQGFITENVRLIESLTGETLDRMERIAIREIQQSTRVETLRDMLVKELQVTKGKANLLARDQTLRLHGRLTEERQTQVGIEEYIWDSSQDSRVRPRHRELHGTRQRWDSPPIVDYKSGRRRHPGQDYQCRCQGIPVLPGELAE